MTGDAIQMAVTCLMDDSRLSRQQAQIILVLARALEAIRDHGGASAPQAHRALDEADSIAAGDPT